MKKTVSVWNGSWTQESEKLFVYEGWNMICEITSENSQPATEKYYVWGLDLSQSLQGAGGIGGLIATLDNSASVVYYYFYDANGNVGQLANAADGSIAAHYEYDPFGNIIKAEGEYKDSNPYRFSTKFFDSETGLIYFGFRFLSTGLGRWLTRDPIEEDGFTYYASLLQRLTSRNKTNRYSIENPDNNGEFRSAGYRQPEIR
ncbi:MAG: RHS repeat-associated core domain-containing protein [Desulfobacteraceae bacterium]|nr:RHS repeat-associated core domain-containing protein [Desulfobacteraceae bacterium]